MITIFQLQDNHIIKKNNNNKKTSLFPTAEEKSAGVVGNGRSESAWNQIRQ